MNIHLSIKKSRVQRIIGWLKTIDLSKWVGLLALVASLIATWYSFHHDYIVAYGDAESHLNIAKRVFGSLTPGFAQLGGIWLPLPHIFLIPFVQINFLWRTGLAGSIVSGLAFIVTAVFLYKTTLLLTDNKPAAFLAGVIFITNPGVLYMQSTPLTELTLIMFFTLSSFYFIKYLKFRSQINYLLSASFFAFCASLSRYDGWFLVGIEMGIIGLINLPWTKFPKTIGQIVSYWDWKKYRALEGKIFIFSTLAYFGIGLWLLWDFLILGNPFYFANSEYSAKSQQNIFLQAGQLPAYKHLWTAFVYYFVTSMSNVGVLLFLVSIVGFIIFLLQKKDVNRFYIALVLGAIFLFNIITLYVGQSIIYIPSLTPPTFGTNLFNVRYGLLMVPFSAVFIGYLFKISSSKAKLLIITLFVLQFSLYGVGYSKVITFQDGQVGVSSAQRPEAERWMNKNYDGGLVLLDDYARTVSILRSGIPMENIIYVGNKPYWAESFITPEKYATWILMKDHDAVWKAIYEDPKIKARLDYYFDQVYTEKEVRIFRRKPNFQNLAPFTGTAE